MFLDEIGEMTAGLQAKLLRFLEEKTFKRVGGLSDIRVDVRVIAATNRNLEQEVQSGKFREDLFYRLQVMPIALPPLRERHGDIPLLASFYIDLFNREFKRHVRGASPDALAMLEQYQWPGNVREMRKCDRARDAARRSGLAAAGDFTTLTRSVTPIESSCRPKASASTTSNDSLIQALERSAGNQTQAGQLLGINRDQVRYRIEKFGLSAKN